MTAVHRHHRKLRAQGGDDSADNIIDLPPFLHSAVHEHPALAYEHGLLVHSYDDPALIPADVDGFLAALGHTPVGTGPEGGKKPCPRCHGEGTVVEKVKGPDLEPSPERPKVVLAIRVPKDEREDGHEILTALLDAWVEKLAAAGLLRNANAGGYYYSLVYGLRYLVTDVDVAGEIA